MKNYRLLDRPFNPLEKCADAEYLSDDLFKVFYFNDYSQEEYENIKSVADEISNVLNSKGGVR